jgi:hypothetical protein
MQCNRNGGAVSSRSRLPVPLPPLDRVRGVGICDVLCVELERCQIESLLNELDQQRRRPIHGVSADERARLVYERDVLDMISRQLRGDDDATVVWGPARVISAVVIGATRHAAAVLVAETRDDTSPDALAKAGRVAAAWAETQAAMLAVEWYSFDPDLDPLWP